MGLPHEFTVRLSAAQYRVLEKLCAKLGVGKADVLRIALSRLAESEKLIESQKR